MENHQAKEDGSMVSTCAAFGLRKEQ